MKQGVVRRSPTRRPIRAFERSYLEPGCWVQAYEVIVPLLRQASFVAAAADCRFAQDTETTVLGPCVPSGGTRDA